ncbi:MAG TPA: 4Fe-4S dicluster domain-containing protein [Baekduia sp.]
MPPATAERHRRVPRNSPPAVFARRTKERIVAWLDPRLAPLTTKLAFAMFTGNKYAWLRRLPSLPRWVGGWAVAPVWRGGASPTPPKLQSYVGTVVDPEGERRAYEERPLHSFTRTHAEAVMWALERAWPWMLLTYPRFVGALRELSRAEEVLPAAEPLLTDPAELAQLVQDEARRIGMSDVGFAPADPKYTFGEYATPDPGDTIVVCVMEQDWAATQTAPSSKAERAAFRSYGELFPKVAQLVAFLKGLGYETRSNDPFSLEGIAIHYGVQAGMGQLGLNGQLLTRVSGSRSRLALITTKAPIRHGEPTDHGIPKICDECQLCVRRCPPGAIPKARHDKRGVLKAAIKPERCFPILAQTHGCAVCIKVCPIQRYGLDAVKDHYLETGAILGKGSRELETYVWPLDGRAYGPGEKPKMSADLINPPTWPFDKDAYRPLPGEEGAQPAPAGVAWAGGAQEAGHGA